LIADFVLVVMSVFLYKVIPGSLNGSELMSDLHGMSGMMFFILVLIHFILNYKWVKLNYFGKK